MFTVYSTIKWSNRNTQVYIIRYGKVLLLIKYKIINFKNVIIPHSVTTKQTIRAFYLEHNIHRIVPGYVLQADGGSVAVYKYEVGGRP